MCPVLVQSAKTSQPAYGLAGCIAVFAYNTILSVSFLPVDIMGLILAVMIQLLAFETAEKPGIPRVIESADMVKHLFAHIIIIHTYYPLYIFFNLNKICFHFRCYGMSQTNWPS